jgi:hypothetical protein
MYALYGVLVMVMFYNLKRNSIVGKPFSRVNIPRHPESGV